jgi:hypothetical protein
MPTGEDPGYYKSDFLAGRHGSLNGRIRQRKQFTRDFYETFNQTLVISKVNGAGAATGTAGDINTMSTGRNTFLYSPKGTQTIVAPAPVATGLDFGMDQTDNDGVEFVPGILADNRRKGCFKVGTDDAFFCRAKIKLPDVSGTDDCCVGFRKAEAFQANVDDYDEGFWINVNLGDILTERILNNAATATTDSTLNAADGDTLDLEVRVSAAGVCTAYVNGVLIATQQAHTFDAAEFVVPFIFYLQATTSPQNPILIEWECDLQVDAVP